MTTFYGVWPCDYCGELTYLHEHTDGSCVIAEGADDRHDEHLDWVARNDGRRCDQTDQ